VANDTTPRDEALRLARGTIREWAIAGHRTPLSTTEILARTLIEADLREIAAQRGRALDESTDNSEMLTAVRAANATLTAERDSLRAELAASAAQHNGMQKALYKMLETTRAELAAAQAERDEARADRDTMSRTSQQSVSHLTTVVDGWKDKVRVLLAQRDEARKEVGAWREMYKSAEIDHAKATAQRDEARRAVERAEHERDAYRSMLCDVVACSESRALPEGVWNRLRALLKDGPEPLVTAESEVAK